jgi:hypothetical protein
VCSFSYIDKPPVDHAIRACCGTQFGYDDVAITGSMLKTIMRQKGLGMRATN